MLPIPAPKRAQARTTIQHSPREPKTPRPVVFVPSPRRHLRPRSGQVTHRPLKDFERRLHPSPSAQPTHLPHKSPPHPFPIARATTHTAMPLQPATHRHRNLPARGRTASPLPPTARKRSPTLTDPTPQRPLVEAWTKPLPKFPRRQGAKTPQPPMAIVAVAAPSTSDFQAIKPIVLST